MIGGEFEIDLTQRGTFKESPDTYYYASGRAALYQIICFLKVKRVWLPDYLCISVVEAVKKADGQVVFYELDDNLDPKFETLSPDESDAILLINYFGLKDLNVSEDKIAMLFPNTVIIEDDVQAYYDFIKPANPYVHFRFTSLRKTFPVPDGGLVHTKQQMPQTLYQNSFTQYKLKAADLKYHRTTKSDDRVYLTLFEKGEEMIDENYDSQMSTESQSLFARCDLEKIKKKRKENAICLLEGLKQLGIRTIIPIPESKTPLFIPVWLENRDEVRKRMFFHNIFCPIHWPLEGFNLDKGKEMAEHELSIILDQRYQYKDISLILNCL